MCIGDSPWPDPGTDPSGTPGGRRTCDDQGVDQQRTAPTGAPRDVPTGASRDVPTGASGDVPARASPVVPTGASHA
ncbi:hypothetical protein DNP13_24870 [Salmonella enterica subsp. enterica serovar Panama]|nr:hypothetical protein DNP13_24870 [Salmonella enterica subsp. enterica serovar Panama]